jgi:hypothetical protein
VRHEQSERRWAHFAGVSTGSLRVGHAGEIESATGVEMMHISQSLAPLLLHIVRRCSVIPVIPAANAGGAIKKAPPA